jgi:SNF2 family DNA or RNA helicase
MGEIKCEDPMYMRILNGIVGGEVIQLLNAGNVSGAIERLGVQTSSKETIIEVVTKQLNIKMSNIIKKVRYISELEYTRDAEIELQQKKLDALRKEQEGINDSIESVKQRIQQVDTGMCPICYDTLEHPVTVTCCNHLFCVECLTKCLTQSVSYSNCPMCRTKVTTSDIIVVGKNDSVTPVNTFPTKHKVIQNLINSNKDGKFLIFSSHDQSFNKIQSYLIRENISNAQLMGSASRIQNVVNNYKDGNISVLMLNSQHFGSGLNLQNTTDLIFYHRMSEDMERQVIGRAQRFGRTSPLNVHYLCYNNEYKEYN